MLGWGCRGARAQVEGGGEDGGAERGKTRLARTAFRFLFASERRWRRVIHHPPIETAGGGHSHAALDFVVSVA